MRLKSKKILLGITGSIAAYKAATLARLLMKEGAEVKVILTPSAAAFITPLSLSTLTQNEAHVDFFDNNTWNNHVELGLWADLFIIAPATANTLAKMANGICDNMLLASYLSAKCPVFFAPAMDLDMWKHPSTQRNITTLLEYGNQLIPVENGLLASGLVGKGRLAEPEHIVEYINNHFGQQSKHLSKTILITAGPTYEKIDPVRFIGNHSSGKMGFAIAQALADIGSKVILVKGPTKLNPPQHPNIQVINVQTALEMYDACQQHYPTCDGAILAAAVADYRPINPADSKIKKTKDSQGLTLELVENPDIAKHLGSLKTNQQINIGFALETSNEAANAHKKVLKKNFDFIVLNSLNDKGAGFNHDTNKVSFIDKNNNIQRFELKTKAAVAQDIIDKLIELFDA